MLVEDHSELDMDFFGLCDDILIGLHKLIFVFKYKQIFVPSFFCIYSLSSVIRSSHINMILVLQTAPGLEVVLGYSIVIVSVNFYSYFPIFVFCKNFDIFESINLGGIQVTKEL